MGRKFDLEQRLVKFAVTSISFAEILPSSFSGKHLSGQLIRSAPAPALHYGEAESAESRKGFIHKLKIALKELRETRNIMMIIHQLAWLNETDVNALLRETIELISIFSKSISTTQKNNTNKN